ncbi:hypothetical protein DYD21_16305 [Rhodohalobacter sp. SW132]|nr:hypothetical protein DYD21_16305 [Rhodohalobacter sp. SW132]
MPSAEVRDKLLSKNYPVDRCPYATYDALASEEDLEKLFSLLSGYRDSNGNTPVITANTIMANPDFDKIRESGFTEYHYELFTETLKRYPSHKNSFELWKQARSENLIFPQFHGREHLNVKAWLDVLYVEDSGYRAVFPDEVTWLGPNQNGDSKISIRAAFDTDTTEDIKKQREIIREGLDMFESLFGYRSKSFIAPNFVYPSDLNEPLFQKGVRYIQGMKYQKLPMLDRPKREMVRHYQGEKNEAGQYHTVRNCVFEPSQYPIGRDNVSECLKGIKNAFFWRKPAVITAHRLNFIGFIDSKNRDRNLDQFRELLDAILKKWPDVEFMNSSQLGELIEQGRE